MTESQWSETRQDLRSARSRFSLWLWRLRQVQWSRVVLFALLIYLTSLLYQANEAWRQTADRSSHEFTVRASLPSDSARVLVLYPEVVPLVEVGEPGVELTVRVTPVEPVTVIQADTIENLTYTVDIDTAGTAILLTDAEGMPVAPSLMRVSNRAVSDAVTFYLRAGGAATGPQALRLGVSLFDTTVQRFSRQTVVLNPRVEGRWHALGRRLKDLCLGPTTPLLFLAATLVGYAVKQSEWSRNEQAKQREEIDRVAAMVPEDLSGAVRRYGDLVNRADRNDWFADAQTHLSELGALIRARGEGQLLKTALGHLEEGHVDEAASYLNALAHIVHNGAGADDDRIKKLETATHLLLRYREAPSATATRWWASDSGVQDAVQAVDALWASISRPEYELRLRLILTPPLAALAAWPEASGAFRRIAESREGRELLREAAFDEPLAQLQVSAPGEAKELQRLRDIGPQAPSVWVQRDRLVETQAVEAFLRKFGLTFNPFGPEQAEHDPRLVELYDGDYIQQASRPRPCLIFGAPGSGRTATALVLVYQRRTAGALSVYYQPPHARSEATPLIAELEILARSTARECIRWMVAAPHLYCGLDKDERSSLGHFLVSGLGSWSRVEQFTRRAAADARRLAQEELNRGIPAEEAAPAKQEAISEASLSYLVRTLHASCPTLGDVQPVDEAGWLDLFASARLKNQHEVWVAFDLPSVSRGPSPGVTDERVQYLLDLSPALAIRRVYLKLFAPVEMAPRLHTSYDTDSFCLTWDAPRLMRLLTRRLTRAGADSFDQLVDVRGIDVRAEDEFTTAVMSAAGTPRCLIRLGNALLAQHAGGDETGRISLQQFSEVLGRAMETCP